MLLHNTQNAIAELAANRQAAGAHMAHHSRIGRDGFIVDEFPFDPSMHQVSDIDPFSMVGRMTGRPQVTEVNPESSLDINIVVHADPAEQDDPQEIVRGRKILVDTLRRALRYSLLRNDNAMFYVVGRHDTDLADRDSTFIEATDKEAAAEAITKLSKKGLTIVMGTLKNLPLDQIKDNHSKLVAVKTNHIWDRQLGRNLGVWDTGEPDMPVVNTNDRAFGRPSKELGKHHDRQERRHREIVDRLKASGVEVAEATFDKTLEPRYFDVKSVDKSIAKAVKRAGR